MSKLPKSGWDENGIYREYGEDGTLLLEQTSYGSVNPMCEAGKTAISGMRQCVIFEPARPGTHPSGINGGLGASLIGACDDCKAMISGNLFDLVEGLKTIDASLLLPYEREMIEEAIPQIIRDVERRQLLAIEARKRILLIPDV